MFGPICKGAPNTLYHSFCPPCTSQIQPVCEYHVDIACVVILTESECFGSRYSGLLAVSWMPSRVEPNTFYPIQKYYKRCRSSFFPFSAAFLFSSRAHRCPSPRPPHRPLLSCFGSLTSSVTTLWPAPPKRG